MLSLTHHILTTSAASTYCTPYRNPHMGDLYQGRTRKTGAAASHAVVSWLGHDEIRQACIQAMDAVVVRHHTPGKDHLDDGQYHDVKTDLLGLAVEEVEMDGRKGWVVW